MKIIALIESGALLIGVIWSVALSAYDLTTTKVQYIMTTSHVDDQVYWTWDVSRDNYIPMTVNQNLYVFHKYPNFVMNWEGSFRYQSLKTRQPALYDSVKKYVALKNWHPSPLVTSGEFNTVSFESIVRQIYYSNIFYWNEFQMRPKDLLLPDNFGYGFWLPTVAVHCGMTGFSSQKIYCEWLAQPSCGSYPNKPFDMGVWIGPDDKGIIASVDPHTYVTFNGWTSVLSPDRIQTMFNTAGIYCNVSYLGCGDTGGSCCCNNRGCTEQDVIDMNAAIAQNSTAAIKVVLLPGDSIFGELLPYKNKFKTYKGEFLPRSHGVDGYTTCGEMKTYNEKNELLAVATEAASSAASALKTVTYPTLNLRNTWIQFLEHQFHDTYEGTDIQAAYTQWTFPAEDSAIASFTTMRNTAITGVAGKLATSNVQGVPVVVFNALGFDREDLVSVDYTPSGTKPAFIAVYGPDGIEVPSQIVNATSTPMKIVFLAKAPSAGFSVYDVRPATAASSLQTGLSASTTQISNNFYTVTIDANGDISSIIDKTQNNLQILKSPVQLQLMNDAGDQWECPYTTMTSLKATVNTVTGVSVVENGPARVTLRVQRSSSGSTFSQDISLAAGDAGKIIQVNNTINYNTPASMLKSKFSFVASNANATFDLPIGTIQRTNETSTFYEYSAKFWADLTNSNNANGVAVLSNCRHAWDKPDNNTLRLTLGIEVPGSFDIGQHVVGYAIYSHGGTWQTSDVVGRGERFTQQLVGMQTTPHAGTLGNPWSFLELNTRQVGVLAIKKGEEDTSKYIVRFRELLGSDVASVTCAFAAPITSAIETDGQEKSIGTAPQFAGNVLTFSMGHYAPRTFALTLGDPVPINIQNQKLPGPTSIGAWSITQENGIVKMHIPDLGRHIINIYSLAGCLINRYGTASQTIEMRLPRGIMIVSVQTAGIKERFVRKVVNW
jgi:alpha-mannosidase